MIGIFKEREREIINGGQQTINKISEEKFPELKNMDLHIKGSTKYLAYHSKISEY